MTVSFHHSFSPSFGSLYILSLPSSVNLYFFTFFIVLFKHTFRPVLHLVCSYTYCPFTYYTTDIMKYQTTSVLIAFFGLTLAAPMPAAKNLVAFSIPRAMLRGREVPQEHSHDRFLDGVRVNLAIDNPAGIQDPVFGLLGDAAAAAGAGTITNLECLHQATADQAFTNAKASGNVTGQADALLYAALERNTGKVGLASVRIPFASTSTSNTLQPGFV
jgi:hypothetical protein